MSPFIDVQLEQMIAVGVEVESVGKGRKWANLRLRDRTFAERSAT
jgi:hypothetical protein